MAIFLDTNVVIYLIEWTPQFGRLAANRIESLLLQGERLVVSDLVRMECRVRPLRMNDGLVTKQLVQFYLFCYDFADVRVD